MGDVPRVVWTLAAGRFVGQYQGLYTGAATSGTILAPPIGAFVYSAAPGLLWPACAVAAVGAGLVAWRAGRTDRSRKPLDPPGRDDDLRSGLGSGLARG
jgi:hypothetical protein